MILPRPCDNSLATVNARTLRTLLLLGIALPGLASCVGVTDVPGPDGEMAHLIACDYTKDCYSKASSLCPDGYDIRSVDGRPGKIETLVSCKADIPSTPAPVAAPAVPQREDARVCEAASAHVADFAKYWASHSINAKPLEELPQTPDFVAVCHAMPENVQRCMHSGYRAAHMKGCDAVLLRLDTALRNKVDGLFLEAPTKVATEAGMP
jgi:hypothetical protein